MGARASTTLIVRRNFCSWFTPPALIRPFSGCYFARRHLANHCNPHFGQAKSSVCQTETLPTGVARGGSQSIWVLRSAFVQSGMIRSLNNQFTPRSMSTERRKSHLASSPTASREPGRGPEPLSSGQASRGVFACARADEKPTSAAERLRPGRQRDAVFALARLAAPPVRGGPMKSYIAGVLA